MRVCLTNSMSTCALPGGTHPAPTLLLHHFYALLRIKQRELSCLPDQVLFRNTQKHLGQVPKRLHTRISHRHIIQCRTRRGFGWKQSNVLMWDQEKKPWMRGSARGQTRMQSPACPFFIPLIPHVSSPGLRNIGPLRQLAAQSGDTIVSTEGI